MGKEHGQKPVCNLLKISWLNLSWNLPFPVPLMKNWSSASSRGRGLSMGTQYLQKCGQSIYLWKQQRESTRLHATAHPAPHWTTSQWISKHSLSPCFHQTQILENRGRWSCFQDMWFDARYHAHLAGELHVNRRLPWAIIIDLPLSTMSPARAATSPAVENAPPSISALRTSALVHVKVASAPIFRTWLQFQHHPDHM